MLPNQPEAGIYHYGVDLPAAKARRCSPLPPGPLSESRASGPGGLEMLVQHDGFVGIYSHFGTIMPAFAEGSARLRRASSLAWSA